MTLRHVLQFWRNRSSFQHRARERAMGLIGSFLRLMIGIVFFVALIILGAIFAPQLAHAFGQLPGTLTINSGNNTIQIPILASIVASLILTLIVNLIALPFRSRSAE
jgi:ABC-type phosphate transport system permease subunit